MDQDQQFTNEARIIARWNLDEEMPVRGAAFMITSTSPKVQKDLVEGQKFTKIGLETFISTIAAGMYGAIKFAIANNYLTAAEALKLFDETIMMMTKGPEGDMSIVTVLRADPSEGPIPSDN